MVILGSEGKGNPTLFKRSLVVMSGNEKQDLRMNQNERVLQTT